MRMATEMVLFVGSEVLELSTAWILTVERAGKSVNAKASVLTSFGLGYTFFYNKGVLYCIKWFLGSTMEIAWCILFVLSSRCWQWRWSTSAGTWQIQRKITKTAPGLRWPVAIVPVTNAFRPAQNVCCGTLIRGETWLVFKQIQKYILFCVWNSVAFADVNLTYSLQLYCFAAKKWFAWVQCSARICCISFPSRAKDPISEHTFFHRLQSRRLVWHNTCESLKFCFYAGRCVS